MKNEVPPERRTIGILGAGQLGTLLGKALQKLGATPIFYDENPTAPGLRQFPGGASGSWTDARALRHFLEGCDYLTFEFENVDLSVVESMARACGVPAMPGFHVMRTAQNRILEKEFLSSNGFPLGAFAVLPGHASAATSLGFPLIVKTATLGYDGKGQWRVESANELQTLLEQVTVPLVAEEPIALAAEASVIVCRSSKGEITVFPVFENLHEHHVLAYTVLPARIPQMVSAALVRVAVGIAESLKATGLLAVEFFLSRSPGRQGAGLAVDGWYIFVNELAPRPHNSGHITLNACNLSQFDALARVLCGTRLQPLQLRPGGWCMGNLLGDIWPAPEAPLDLGALARHPRVSDVVLYGKDEARPGRKMGHFAIEHASPDDALWAAERFKADLVHDNRPG